MSKGPAKLSFLAKSKTNLVASSIKGFGANKDPKTMKINNLAIVRPMV
jgi:hypothetical protein